MNAQMKKAARWLNLAAFVVANGWGTLNDELQTY